MNSMVGKQVGTDWLLYDPHEDAVHILNPAARMILEMHHAGASVENIAEALCASFEVPASQALEEDVRKSIQDMTARSLL